jgi:dTDP-4-dehydrorhamnose 3,5-epimerase
MTFSLTEMTTTDTAIAGLAVFGMKQVTDDRGTVREFYRNSAHTATLGAAIAWKQINVTETRYGAVRGLHGEAMTKLVACVAGEAFGVYLDTRVESPSYREIVTVPLVAGTQVLVPSGVCNAFQSLSAAGTQYLYCFDSEWTPGMAGLAFNPLDAGLPFSWPIAVDTADPAQISAKDAGAPLFSALAH